MEKLSKIFLSIALAVFMTVSSLPVNTVFADDEVPATTEVAEQEPAEEKEEVTEVAEVPEETVEVTEEEPAEEPEEVAELPAETEDPAEETELPSEPVETVDEADPLIEEDPADTTVVEEEPVSDEPAEDTPAEDTDLPEDVQEVVEPVYLTGEGEYDGVTVKVGYFSDAFDKEVTLVVSAAGEAETAALDAAFDGDYKAVDISFVDADGNECQPLEGKTVDVTLSAKEMIAGNLQAMHVDGEGNIEFIEEGLNVSNSGVTTKEVEVLVPEEVEVPVYEEKTITVPAEIGTKTVEKTRDVEKTRTVRVRVAFKWYDPSTWSGYKYENQTYTTTEKYTEEEEYVITPEHTETVTEQVGTEWQETGEMVTVTRTVEVMDIDASFYAAEFSTYAIRTDTITSGQEYVIYRDLNGTDYALAHDLGREAITLKGNGTNQTVHSASDNIKWLFESSGNNGYKISYMNNGTKTYLRAYNAGLYITNWNLTTTTNADDSGTTWTYATNNLRIHAS